ncbi:acetoacetate decarboxylase family protein [Neptunicella sp. SCSIO 80796]|uniref:acetoacetate decarboxylase family protein n=1 Tax=Neptunicella plasticusilytica TaxID=3117012 RepID=UPI003A4D6168
MAIPKRIKQLEGRHALVDGIPFQLPVACQNSPAIMAVFPINADKAKALMPFEVHPFRLWNKALLVITVIDYRETNIGKYIEYSIAIACTHGLKSAPRLLPALLMQHYGTGQYVIDLPVSSDISVKGGKGIWGMPKHKANLDFNIGEDKISSQYDLDGKLVTYFEINKPSHTKWSMQLSAPNYCAFRGMLMKSYIHFKGKVGLSLFGAAKARFVIGDHPRAQVLHTLEIGDKAIATVYLPSIGGTLDDHFESWFLSYAQKPQQVPQGLESVVDLGLDETWLEPPRAPVPEDR